MTAQSCPRKLLVFNETSHQHAPTTLPHKQPSTQNSLFSMKMRPCAVGFTVPSFLIDEKNPLATAFAVGRP